MGLDCYDNKSTFRDHRKLSFIIDFVSDSKLLDIIENHTGGEVNQVDRDLLNQSYTNSLLRIRTINQLIFTLTNEGFIEVVDKRLEKLSIRLIAEKVEREFIKGAMFGIERNNIKRLKRTVQRISVLDITTLLSQLYFYHGVIDEQIIN